MKNKVYKAQRKRLLKLADEWVRPIGLGWWKVKLDFDREGVSFKDSMHEENGFRSGSAARCFPDWRYSMATIIFNMPEIVHHSDNELEFVFVHELMHIFLHEMREGANVRKQLPHEERVATALAKAFVWHKKQLQGSLVSRESDDDSNSEHIKRAKIKVVARPEVDATRG